MKYIYTLIISITTLGFSAQNLVLNPSFETVNTGSLQCSWYTSGAQFTSAISNWTYPTDGSTDVFHTSLATSCYSSPFSTHANSNGSQAPRTGSSMVAVVTYGSGGCTPYREYVQGQLSSALTVGSTYNVEFYVSLGDNMTLATNNLGVKFTTTPQSTNSMCVWNTTPDVNYSGAPITDETNWTLMSFTFTPTAAGLDNFSIGNFFTDGATATTAVSGSKSTIRYFVDDVSIELACPVVNPAWTNPGSICAAAGSINLNSLITGTAGGTWSGTGVSGSTFNPASGTQSVTYSVGAGACAQTSIKTITVLPNVTPTWSSPGTICAAAGSISLNSLITGTTGGTWSGTGVSGSTFNPASGTQSITYTVGTSPCTESSSATITVIANVTPTWTNPSNICTSAGSINLNSLITGTTGGTWSGTGVSGSTFNPSSGTQSVTYSVGTAPCIETSSQTITVLSNVTPTWTSPGTICAAAGSVNLNTLITGTTGGTWSGTGVSGSTFNPSSGTQSITYTVGTAPCTESSSATITVIANVTPTWTNPSNICASAGSINLNSLITGTTGGTWSGTGVSGSTFNPSSGTQSVTYSVGTAPCIETSSQTITVLSNVTPTWTSPGTICAAAGSVNLNTLITGTTGGTWSGTGVSGSTFNPSSGTQSITYTVGTAPCTGSSTLTITVVPNVTPTWTNPGPLCIIGGSVNLDSYITGTTGGTWSGTGVSGSTFNPSSGTQSVTYSVGTGACVETSVLSISVLPDVDPTWTSPGTICAAAGSINLNSLITGTTGGTWSGTGVSGSTFDPNVGTQSVTYSVGASPCTESLAITINVLPNVDPTWTNPGPLCEASGSLSLNSLITGTTGGTWSGTGVTGTSFDPAGISTSTNVTYSVGSGACVETSMLTVAINVEDDASFSYATGITYCATGINPVATITLSGGTFTISPSGTIDPSTGEINLGATGVGSYTVTYNTTVIGNPCPQTSTVSISITASPTASFNYGSAQFCNEDSNPVLTLPVGATTGTFTSSPVGLSVNSTTGAIDLLASTPNTYWIYNDVAAASGCVAALDSIEITIHPNFITPLSTFICDGDSILLGGSYQFVGGVYNDTLSTVFGCDSILTTTLTIIPIVTTPLVASICTGDSLLVGGSFQTVSGVYNDTIMNMVGCDSILSTTLTVVPLNTITADLAQPICIDDVALVSATASGAGTITWYSDSAGTTIIGTGSSYSPTITTTGTYTYYVNEAGTCPSGMDSIELVVGGVNAVIDAYPTTGLTPLPVFFGNGSTTGPGITYDWDLGDGETTSQFEPNYTYEVEGAYDVILIVSDGLCTDSTMITVDVSGASVLIIPNIFTPNGDGLNDVFRLTATNLVSMDAQIFNRWGQLVYSWTSLEGAWDGRTLSGLIATEGTYFYIISAEGADGIEYLEQGPFSLIR